MVHPVFQADAHEHFLRAPRALSGRNARVNQRQLHVLERVEPRQKLKLLKDKADFLAADMRQLVFIQIANHAPMQNVFARRRCIQTADDIHQRGFAAARRAEDGEKFALFNIQIDSLENGLHFISHLILLDNAAHFEKVVAHSGLRSSAGALLSMHLLH